MNKKTKRVSNAEVLKKLEEVKKELEEVKEKLLVKEIVIKIVKEQEPYRIIWKDYSEWEPFWEPSTFSDSTTGDSVFCKGDFTNRYIPREASFTWNSCNFT